MSSLRRTLSLRRSRRSYKTLSLDPQKGTIPTIVEGEAHGARSEVDDGLQATKRFSSIPATSTPVRAVSTAKEKEKLAKSADRKSVKSGAFPSFDSVKSALINMKQKLKGSQTKKVRLRDSTMSVVNGAYVTPRRSNRLQAKSTPSPISLKMYSPFCIETPGMEDSFVRLSKRKALTDLNESPLTKTPRRMVKAALSEHKKLAKNISSSQVATATLSGY